MQQIVTLSYGNCIILVALKKLHEVGLRELHIKLVKYFFLASTIRARRYVKAVACGTMTG